MEEVRQNRTGGGGGGGGGCKFYNHSTEEGKKWQDNISKSKQQWTTLPFTGQNNLQWRQKSKAAKVNIPYCGKKNLQMDCSLQMMAVWHPGQAPLLLHPGGGGGGGIFNGIFRGRTIFRGIFGEGGGPSSPSGSR